MMCIKFAKTNSWLTAHCRSRGYASHAGATRIFAKLVLTLIPRC